VSASLRREFRARFGKPVFVHYGAREFGRISTTYLGDSDDALESVGAPVPWVELEIVDAEGNALPADAIGELRVRSECMSHEYHGDAVATARHFRNGWFYPGDLASLTLDGTVRVHGRADDMMILNSIKIFPAEIERVLEEHPGVKAAAAFARPSRAHGDIPLAAVELHPSAGIANEELLARARERLGVRAPRRIIVVDALPRNAAGKILKHELIDLIGRDG
jgi:acyl-CoA synthetase (AMP-forming)/AMP-acid ligase II